mmetsp:Transcript_79378/g.149848  ORF Transcript_79378/g.149848 Transcript_79378/m.149848 type:complete len:254 (-) Transcript_79378:54-815(-)
MGSKRQTPSATLDAKRLKATVDESAGEFVCPITHALPVDPVTAEDGHVYERSAILDWFSKGRGTSPMTNETMGTRLTSAVQVRSMIERMVRSGAVMGDKAEPWIEEIKVTDEVKEAQTQAENGCAKAMGRLALTYAAGRASIKKDTSKALQWATQGAHKGDASSMCILAGLLAEKGTSHFAAAVHWRTCAAENGSEYACYVLGFHFQEGLRGLPQDHKLAAKWYNKMKDCHIKDASESARIKASDFLLQTEPS